jgi:hypothetical protein
VLDNVDCNSDIAALLFNKQFLIYSSSSSNSFRLFSCHILI